MYHPTSKPKSLQLNTPRDDESFIDFDSDTIYASARSRSSFSLYAGSMLSSSPDSSEGDEAQTPHDDTKREPERDDLLYNPSPRPRQPPPADEELNVSIARYPYLRTPTPTSGPANSSTRETLKMAAEDERYFASRSSSPEPFASYGGIRSKRKSKEFPFFHQRTPSLPQSPPGSTRIPVPSGADVVQPRCRPRGPRSMSAHFPSYGHTKNVSSSTATTTQSVRPSSEYMDEFRVRRKRAAKLLKFFGEPVNSPYHEFVHGLVHHDDEDDDDDDEDDVGSYEDHDGSAILKRRATDSKLERVLSPSGLTMGENESPTTRTRFALRTRKDWVGTFAEVLPSTALDPHPPLSAVEKRATMVIDMTEQPDLEKYEKALAILRNI